MKFECDQCGACCKELLVEVYDIDVLREPKLIAAEISQWTRGLTEKQLMDDLEQEGKCLLIAAPGKPCMFLNDENGCNTYATRPSVCVAMRAGDEQCQLARSKQGLEPLKPTD